MISTEKDSICLAEPLRTHRTMVVKRYIEAVLDSIAAHMHLGTCPTGAITQEYVLNLCRKLPLHLRGQFADCD